MEKEDKIKMLANEINDISDINLRNFAKVIVENADDYFFTMPGKYHPDFARGTSGLVRHTRAVVLFAEWIAESRDMPQHEKDLLIIAAIAHDIKKKGNNGDEHTTKDHPECAHAYVWDMAKENPSLINEDDTTIIANAVLSHMGKWGNTLPQTEFEKALQAADYLASRKELVGINFRETENVEVSEQEVKPTPSVNVEPKDYVYSFGKNKGKTISEGGKGYAEWIAKQDDYSDKEVQNMCKLYLESLNTGKKFVEHEPIAPNDVF